MAFARREMAIAPQTKFSIQCIYWSLSLLSAILGVLILISHHLHLHSSSRSLGKASIERSIFIFEAKKTFDSCFLPSASHNSEFSKVFRRVSPGSQSWLLDAEEPLFAAFRILAEPVSSREIDPVGKIQTETCQKAHLWDSLVMI